MDAHGFMVAFASLLEVICNCSWFSFPLSSILKSVLLSFPFVSCAVPLALSVLSSAAAAEREVRN